MRLFLLAVAFLCAAGCASHVTKGRPVTETVQEKHEPLPRDRRAADAVAREELMKMQFFAEGRGMHLAPGYLREYEATAWTGLPNLLLSDRWGFNVVNGNVAGLHDVRYNDMTVGVAGCAACHSGKAAGRFYPGLGNKNFDVTQLGDDLARAERHYVKVTHPKGEAHQVGQSAIAFAETIGDNRTGNLTQGMVPVSFTYGWFYRQDRSGARPPTRGAVKIPALWGFAPKRPAGLFCDGYSVAYPPGWSVAVELTAGQSPETVREYLPAIQRAQETFSALLPPSYPFEADQSLAHRGGGVFAQNCRECHGSYKRDARGLPRFEPPTWHHVEEVDTDTDRVDLNTDHFQHLVQGSPLSDLLRVNPEHRRGYFAPRLDGIWARFPYLHNGSVPNIRALLTAPEERPRVFSMKRAGEGERFDETLLGLTLPDAHAEAALLQRGAAGDRTVYDTRRPGHSPQGHSFGTALPEEEKRELIEYLKTL